MLAGLRSRWTRPCSWMRCRAVSVSITSGIACLTAHRAAQEPVRQRRHSRSSMVMNSDVVLLADLEDLTDVRMVDGCCGARLVARTAAPHRRRGRVETFNATWRFSATSRARYTSPIPPAPRRPTISCDARRVPGANDIASLFLAHDSLRVNSHLILSHRRVKSRSSAGFARQNFTWSAALAPRLADRNTSPPVTSPPPPRPTFPPAPPSPHPAPGGRGNRVVPRPEG